MLLCTSSLTSISAFHKEVGGWVITHNFACVFSYRALSLSAFGVDMITI